VLLRIDGFDPVARRFRYQVNSRFGETQTSLLAQRTPFGVTLDVRMDVGVPATRQQMERFLRPGRDGSPGTKLTRADLQRRYARNVPDPYARILAERDSLLLQPEQIAALQRTQAAYGVRVDSLWADVAGFLAGLPDRFDERVAFDRTEMATDVAWNMGRLELQRTLPGILNQLQLQLLPFPAGLMFRAKTPIKGLRFFVLGEP
jgi:hypothetical protein